MGVGSSRSSSVTSLSPEQEDAQSTRRERRRKRKEAVDDIPSEEDEPSLSPKRQKIRHTSAYIYETFFLKGTGSDVTIKALGNEWKLHKAYLKQSHYFSGMFSGHWMESDLPIIQIDIPDPNITIDALNIAFSSLYKDSVHLNASIAPSTVAAAAMLQMDGLLEHCKQFMKETISPDNVVQYLKTASEYGLHDIKNECQFWLQTRLLTEYTVTMLLHLNTELLTEFIVSPDLFVIQVEMDVYSLAKKWLFLHCHPQWDDAISKLSNAADNFFRQREGEAPFLSTEKGSPHQQVFRSIRLQHILADPVSISVLEKDNIIPQGHSFPLSISFHVDCVSDWLLPLFRQQWLKMIAVDQRTDPGPSVMTPEEFNETTIRCGRILKCSDEYCWRWTGFSFGFDIILSFNNKLISVKRNTRSQPCLSAVSLQNVRPLSLRLRIASFSEGEGGGAASSFQDTGILQLSLSPDETAYVLTVDSEAQFPLYISFNFSLTSHHTNPP